MVIAFFIDDPLNFIGDDDIVWHIMLYVSGYIIDAYIKPYKHSNNKTYQCPPSACAAAYLSVISILEYGETSETIKK